MPTNAVLNLSLFLKESIIIYLGIFSNIASFFLCNFPFWYVTRTFFKMMIPEKSYQPSTEAAAKEKKRYVVVKKEALGSL